ncbi:MAG: LuxR family transcriptional regulator [Flavobacteriaceae bacterium]|nr:LuxR family transcriptional regulator [Bacteroidia bacterium]NNL61785.1 LuxR family transcriptional regulator [Flavobacteriaceae bacterium]
MCNIYLMPKRSLYTCLLFFVTLINSYTQELPPIQAFTPRTYGAEHQNWAISQSAEDYIYVANNKGLLEFDGAKWQLYPSPNETILRSVAVIGNKVFTGCYMEFGYWVKNEFGNLDYTSLKPLLKEKMVEDEQIWKIIPLDNWIVFQSFNRIYLFNTISDEFKIIESNTTITKMYLVDNTIMFQKLGDGIYKIENGEEKLVTSNELIRNETIVNVFSFNGDYLVQTESKGFYVLSGNDLKTWDIQAKELLSSVNVYNSIKLRDGGYMLGTISNGIIHLTNDGELNYMIDQEIGLSNNTVLSLFEDKDQNIWLGLDNGIDCINMKSQFKVYRNKGGKLGTVYSSIYFNDKLYLGTNQGLFFKDFKDDNFQIVEGTQGQVWSLKSYDDTLFCCHNKGTFVIEGNNAKLISRFPGTWDIKAVPSNPDLLLQGKYEGLTLLEKNNDQWQFKNSVEGFVNSAKFFELGPNNSIFVSHEYRGVFKLQINNEFNNALSVNKILELPKSLYASLIKYNDDYLYAYREGVFKYNIALNEFRKDSILSAVFNDASYSSGRMILDIKNNRFWSFANNGISYIGPGKLSNQPEMNKIAIPEFLRNGMTGYENITNLKDQTYLLGATDGYVILDLNEVDAKEYSVRITSINKGSYGLIENAIDLTTDSEIPNTENSLEFSYSVTEYQKFSETTYRYQLKGMYDDWSEWSTTPSVSFNNLPFGDYTFNVEARVGNKQVSNAATFQFRINRPWYLSNLMIALYVLATLILVFITHMLYRRHYRKKQEKVLLETKRQLELKNLENEQQLMQFKNESLKQDIESKNRELAISTMSLIKKNEFLNNLKEELKNKDNDQGLNSVVKIIDKNLNNTDDWKFFQEAFNNADKDFLKKVKNIHPSLTPNDLKLCAYLRLNLSSKEIAPLLNISPRSVEVKRYRLRKKMQLEHETSLTNYILEL